MAVNGLRQAIHITLRGRYNITYSGTLILHGNLSSHFGDSETDTDLNRNGNFSADGEQKYDATGASYFVVAVVLVYGMSIVALIASHMTRRHDKIAEDKQIDKYLQDFQIIKDLHARDSYKNLKKSVMKKINWDRKKETHRSIQQSILPLLAIGVQVGSSKNSSMESINENQPKAKRKVYPMAGKRFSDPDISEFKRFNENGPKRIRRHSHMDQLSAETAHSLSLVIGDYSDLTFEDAGLNYVPDSHLLTVDYGTMTCGQSAETASARRLRFGTNVSTSHLNRSLNSIAEGEEEKDYTPPIPPRSSLTLTQSSGDSLAQEDNEINDAISISSQNSRLAKLRKIGEAVEPSEEPPMLIVPSLSDTNPSFSVEDVDTGDIQFPLTCPDVMVSDSDDVWMMELGPSPSPPPTPRRSFSITPRSLSLVPGTQSQIEAQMATDDAITPGTLLQTIKHSNPSSFSKSKLLLSHRSRSHSLYPSFRRSSFSLRSSSRSPILGRSRWKERPRSSGSEHDRSIEVVEDNPLQITCV